MTEDFTISGLTPEINKPWDNVRIYCDESCHVGSDQIMVLGAVTCPTSDLKRITTAIGEIRCKYRFPISQEMKWTKISPVNRDLYVEVVDFFLAEPSLGFRAVVHPDKQNLSKAWSLHSQSDDRYFKMYVKLLNNLLDPNLSHKIFLDIKDTLGGERSRRIRKALEGQEIEDSQTVIGLVQTVKSDEVILLQLTDILTGAVAFANRFLDQIPSSSSAKKAIVAKVRDYTGFSLTRTTFPRERKMNVLILDPEDLDLKTASVTQQLLKSLGKGGGTLR